MDRKTIQADLDFLVNNPTKSLGSTYHDAGRCWLLIDAAVKEIRKLRKKISSADHKPDQIQRKARHDRRG